MAEVILALTAFSVSFLTLFTGFGLGTLLLPAFALFFPVHIAVASTAIVHGANNLLKTLLLRKEADRQILMRFGVPAMVSAIGGAYLLSLLTYQDTIGTWTILGREAGVTPLKLVMAVLIFAFALFELVPTLRRFRALPKHLVLGGILSGFFGGLSGHQGALRAAFLSPLNLSPTRFAATQAVIGFAVDLMRLPIYAVTILQISGSSESFALPVSPIAMAVMAAFAGALLGKRILPDITLGFMRKLTGVLLILVSLALGVGLT